MLLILLAALLTGEQRGASPKPFVSKLPVQEMTNKQAVVNTSAGTFVIDLRPDLAPTHVAYFMKLAREGAFNGTIFHRVVKHGIIQGGDPLSKDPKNTKLYGTGGLGVLKAEFSNEPPTRGAVAAVLQPGKADSAGSQFFVCVTDQPALAGKYTIFGRVAEGLDVVQKISEVEQVPGSDGGPTGVPASRIEIVGVAIRDTPPPVPEPFSTESVEELAQYRAVLETSAGPVTVEFFPAVAPAHVRNFLRLAQAGVFDGMAFHRVVRGFAVQTGSLGSRGPLTEAQRKFVTQLQPEFNATKHVKGILSMARGDDPASASTSFFVVTADAPSLDGKYTAFGRVVEGMSAVEAIESSPVSGETPVQRVELKTVRVVKNPGR